MAISYNPKDAQSCLPEGEYQATLQDVEEKTSKSSGQPMYMLVWKVYGSDGKEPTLRDYIVMTPKMIWRLKRLAEAFGLRASFDAGTFDPNDLVGENCRVSLEVEEDSEFGDKNRIAAYVKDSGTAAEKSRTVSASQVAKAAAKHGFQEVDDIPFAM